MAMDVGKGKKLKNVVLLRILNISGGKEKITVFQSMKEFYHPCLRLDYSKVLRRKGGINTMCLRPLGSKALR